MMHNSRTIRWFVTACLAFSLTLSGLAPSLMAFAETRSIVDAPQGCCCGTADGRCCGMACCISRTPTAPEKPAQLPTHDDHRPNLLGLARMDASVLALGRFSCGVRPPIDAEFSPAEATLQALHVRLDV